MSSLINTLPNSDCISVNADVLPPERIPAITLEKIGSIERRASRLAAKSKNARRMAEDLLSLTRLIRTDLVGA